MARVSQVARSRSAEVRMRAQQCVRTEKSASFIRLFLRFPGFDRSIGRHRHHRGRAALVLLYLGRLHLYAYRYYVAPTIVD